MNINYEGQGLILRIDLSRQSARIACYLERVATGVDCGIAGWVIRCILWPLSMLYCLGLKIYLWIYSSGIRKRARLDVPVISVGNLTFGGTGKTPAVVALCKLLQHAGHRPAVLSRGHGGSSKRVLVVSSGKDILCSSKRCGDEPIVLARNLPGVPIIVGRDRRRTGKMAIELFEPTVIVLDDGMQYWQLDRDMDIVVMNAMRPFGSNWVMPAGDLREPVSGLNRAGAVLVNCETKESRARFEQVCQQVHSINKDVPVFRCSKTAAGFLNAATGESYPVDWARNRKVAAFCGIGSPESFEHTLQDTGADIRVFIAFRDHQRFTKKDLQRVMAESGDAGAEAIITTEKDASRMAPEEMPENLFVLNIELEIEDIVSLEKHITDRINRENKEASVQETPNQTAG